MPLKDMQLRFEGVARIRRATIAERATACRAEVLRDLHIARHELEKFRRHALRGIRSPDARGRG